MEVVFLLAIFFYNYGEEKKIKLRGKMKINIEMIENDSELRVKIFKD